MVGEVVGVDFFFTLLESLVLLGFDFRVIIQMLIYWYFQFVLIYPFLWFLHLFLFHLNSCRGFLIISYGWTCYHSRSQHPWTFGWDSFCSPQWNCGLTLKVIPWRSLHSRFLHTYFFHVEVTCMAVYEDFAAWFCI